MMDGWMDGCSRCTRVLATGAVHIGGDHFCNDDRQSFQPGPGGAPAEGLVAELVNETGTESAIYLRSLARDVMETTGTGTSSEEKKEVQESAAVKVQAVMRGEQVRKEATEVDEQSLRVASTSECSGEVLESTRMEANKMGSAIAPAAAGIASMPNASQALVLYAAEDEASDFSIHV